MQFDLYCLGDSLFLQNIFNGLAMVTGAGDFRTACAIGAMIGVVLLSVQSILTGKTFNFQTFVVCMVSWYFFFGTTASVWIHDVYGANDRKVDNVPAGVAISGWAISRLGYGLTSLMERGYQSVHAESTLTGDGAPFEGRITSAIRIVNGAAQLKATSAVIDALDADAGGHNANFRRTFVDYVSKCTFIKMQLPAASGGSTFDSIMRNSAVGTDSSLKFDSKIYYTGVWGPDGVQSMTCSDAWKTINAWLANSVSNTSSKFWQKIGAEVLPRDGIDPNSARPAFSDMAAMTTTAMSILTTDQNEAHNMIQAALLHDMFYDGLAKGYTDAYDRTTATMINQAKSQRNIQWAAEGSMFVNTMRPVITFIEGFTYAVMPFAGILMMTGIFGIKLITKYLLLIAWVESWLPVAAVVNSYLAWTCERYAAEFKPGGAGLGQESLSSFDGLNRMADALSDAAATGGMFTAAIPLLTLFLFTGSVFTLNSLTGRMAGADTINEKIRSPDVVQPGAVLQMAPDALGKGPTEHASTDTPGTLDLSSAAQASMSRNRAATESATNSLRAMAGYGGGETFDHSGNADVTASLVRAHQFSTDTSTAKADANTRQFTDQIGLSLSNEGVRTLSAQMGASGKLDMGSVLNGLKGLSSNARKALIANGAKVDSNGKIDASALESAPGLQGGIGINGGVSYRVADATKLANLDNKSYARATGFKFSEDQKNSYAASFGTDMRNASGVMDKHSLNGYSKADVMKAADQVIAMSDAYQESQSFAQSASARQSVDFHTFSAYVANKSAARDMLNNRFDDLVEHDPTAMAAYRNAMNRHMSGGLEQDANADIRSKIEVLANRGQNGLAALGDVASAYYGTGDQPSMEVERNGAAARYGAGNTGFNSGEMGEYMAEAGGYKSNAENLVRSNPSVPNDANDVYNRGEAFKSSVDAEHELHKNDVRNQWTDERQQKAQANLARENTLLENNARAYNTLFDDMQNSSTIFKPSSQEHNTSRSYRADAASDAAVAERLEDYKAQISQYLAPGASGYAFDQDQKAKEIYEQALDCMAKEADAEQIKTTAHSQSVFSDLGDAYTGGHGGSDMAAKFDDLSQKTREQADQAWSSFENRLVSAGYSKGAAKGVTVAMNNVIHGNHFKDNGVSQRDIVLRTLHNLSDLEGRN